MISLLQAFYCYLTANQISLVCLCGILKSELIAYFYFVEKA